MVKNKILNKPDIKPFEFEGVNYGVFAIIIKIIIKEWVEKTN